LAHVIFVEDFPVKIFSPGTAYTKSIKTDYEQKIFGYGANDQKIKADFFGKM